MSQPRDNWRPPQRLEKKRDLYMFLALHMENSPVCGESEKFHKTGIVVCESDKVHKLMSMCCSSKSLHAVQQVMLNTPITLRNCSIYMSRKPCSACTKFLIQGEISSVCYWPRHPELKEDLEQDLKQVDLLFLTSPIISSVFVPLIDHIDKSDKKSEIAHRTRRFRCSKCNPCYTEAVKKEDCEKNCTLLNLQDCVKSCNKQMEDASEYLDILLHCVHGEFAGTFDETFNEIGKEQHIHALQLCFLLAARSDDPDKGVGCLLYDKNGCNKPGYFFGAGYNGYPIGALYGNLPRCGRGDLPKKEALVHAEQNALLFRSNKQIKDTDVLYCSKPPCLPCQNYIDFVGIKRIISVKDSSTKRTVISELKDKFKYVQYKCATEKLTGDIFILCSLMLLCFTLYFSLPDLF
ncbi:cytidine and dCMP deaminase domain-containing protein 1-like isoform X2 [Rhineura floridana]|uniref:cytidine and dCMP deaminase domain-containing protein 1-like isoform X2 n=1 Tax=Rhineura floridana TaxID=261503 RepID=UPI002AC8103C|nr:cytidine and dCMP deaminase domain-containing protein 1-like isoform X2 [Rhineura floridana]